MITIINLIIMITIINLIMRLFIVLWEDP